MKHCIYLLISGAALLGGCSKDKEAVLTLPGEYQTTTTIAANAIVMYTKDGAVDNPQLVDKFIGRSRLNVAKYFFRADVPITDNSSLTLNITADNQAVLAASSPTSSVTTKAEVTLQTPQYLVLSNIDSVSSLDGPTTSSYRCDLLSQKIRTAYPAKRCRAVSYSAGTYDMLCKYRPVQVTAIKDNKLFLPVFSWLVQTGQPSTGTCSLAYSNERNTFNSAVLSQLVAGDTIVVQERTVELIKK